MGGHPRGQPLRRDIKREEECLWDLQNNNVRAKWLHSNDSLHFYSPCPKPTLDWLYGNMFHLASKRAWGGSRSCRGQQTGGSNFWNQILGKWDSPESQWLPQAIIIARKWIQGFDTRSVWSQSPFLFCLYQYIHKCSTPLASSGNVMREPDRNANSQAPPQTCSVKTPGLGPRSLYFNKPLGWFWFVLKFENHCSIGRLYTMQPSSGA